MKKAITLADDGLLISLVSWSSPHPLHWSPVVIVVVVDVRHVVRVVCREVRENVDIRVLTVSLFRYLRRVMTPESIVCPVLEMALKYI
jgi:hypothetical protein